MKKWDRALVTGASIGIGAEFCRQLAAAGTDLVIVARGRERLEAVATELRTEGVAVDVLPADLSTDEGVAAVSSRLAAADAAVDLLVNNAGFGFQGKFWTRPVEDQTSQVDVNVRALVALTHAALARMVPAGRGAVLNVSSGAGFVPGPGSAVYAATKSFVTSFGLSLHSELRGTGCAVTTLCPGFTRTEFQERGGYDTSSLPSFMWQNAPEVAATGLAGVAAGKALAVPGAANRVMFTTAQMVPGRIASRAAALVSDRLG